MDQFHNWPYIAVKPVYHLVKTNNGLHISITVPKNDPKVEVCVNEQPTIPGHVYTLGGSETTFHKIFTHIGGPKKPKKPRNFLENWVLFTIVANGFRLESWYYIQLLQSMAIPSH